MVLEILKSAMRFLSCKQAFLNLEQSSISSIYLTLLDKIFWPFFMYENIMHVYWFHFTMPLAIQIQEFRGLNANS